MDEKETTVDSSRNFSVRGLSDNIPRPNIVRIETLDGAARSRYLTGIYTGTNQLRDDIHQSVVPDAEKKFYGFLSPNADFSFNMTGSWEGSALGGMAIGGIKKVADIVDAGKAVSSIFDAGQTAYEIASSLTQMNSTSTGSSTMQDFKNVSLDQFAVSCVWYIPEQEKIAQTSLRIIYRMLYPRQLNADSAAYMLGKATSNVINAAGEAAVTSASKLTASDNEHLKSNVSKPASPEGGSDAGVLSGAISTVAGVSGSMVSGGVQAINAVGTFFGYNTTMNPLPVRVSIGQYIDVEPLVITGIETKFSRETFISENTGRHLPLFAYTTIHFKYWLNPAPNLQFANILGTELFGT